MSSKEGSFNLCVSVLVLCGREGETDPLERRGNSGGVRCVGSGSL